MSLISITPSSDNVHYCVDTSYKQICITCGKKIIGYNNKIVYHRGLFCGEICKNEDIRRFGKSESRGPIKRIKERTLMMNYTSGRNTSCANNTY
jgi:hypothetical protein